jgi:hypothetical protein
MVYLCQHPWQGLSSGFHPIFCPFSELSLQIRMHPILVFFFFGSLALCADDDDDDVHW